MREFFRMVGGLFVIFILACVAAVIVLLPLYLIER